MIGGGLFHAVRLAILAAPQIARADHDGDFCAQVAQPAHLAGHDVGLVRINAEAAFAGQGLAAQLQQDRDDSAACSSVSSAADFQAGEAAHRDVFAQLGDHLP